MTSILNMKAFKAYHRFDRKIYDVDRVSHNASGSGWLVYGNLPGQKSIFLGLDGKECSLMRHTGRADKTGRDIYEGYILKYILPPEHGPDDSPDIYIVKWAEHGFEAVWANPATPRSSADGHLSMQDTEKDMEIIGTIFENPELLEKYKK